MNLSELDEQNKLKDFLLIYELPTMAEFISVGWMQQIIANHLAHKINRKMKRYNNRPFRKAELRERIKAL